MKWIALLALLFGVGCQAAAPMKILTSGDYALSGPKLASVVGQRGDVVTDWRVICTSCGKTFAHGQADPVRSLAGNKREWAIDFSAMDVEDEVILECDTNHGTIVSAPFLVRETTGPSSTRPSRN